MSVLSNHGQGTNLARLWSGRRIVPLLIPFNKGTNYLCKFGKDETPKYS